MHKERCGILLEGDQLIELPNLHPDPYNGFAMESHHLETEGIIGTWHTHPATSANLSTEDYRLFIKYPNLKHYIISNVETWSFFVEDDALLCEYNEDHLLPRLP